VPTMPCLAFPVSSCMRVLTCSHIFHVEHWLNTQNKNVRHLTEGARIVLGKNKIRITLTEWVKGQNFRHASNCASGKVGDERKCCFKNGKTFPLMLPVSRHLGRGGNSHVWVVQQAFLKPRLEGRRLWSLERWVGMRAGRLPRASWTAEYPTEQVGRTRAPSENPNDLRVTLHVIHITHYVTSSHATFHGLHCILAGVPRGCGKFVCQVADQGQFHHRWNFAQLISRPRHDIV